MPIDILKNIRTNPTTGERDYFFPMEILDSNVEEYAKLNGLDIGRAMLGGRTFKAVMVPCKRTAYDAQGRQVYLDTSSEEQRRIYMEYGKEERTRQDELRRDDRCVIQDDYGTGFWHCPRRILNPAYTPGGDQPRTLAKKCEGCTFEHNKNNQAIVPLSFFECEDDDGETKPFEVPSPRGYYAGDGYEEHAVGFVDFVRTRRPDLVPLAEKLLQGFTPAEASVELGKSTHTTYSQKEVLKKLLTEYLENAAI